jgi:hypothetical protein
MGFRIKPALLATVAFVLASCGGPGSFETEGLIAPSKICAVTPGEIGQAEPLEPIDEGNGCRIPNPWRIRTIGNVVLSQPATVNCGMAEPLNDWLQDKLQPAAQRTFGESVVGIDVAASYSCRPRNNQSGAKMSEHGFGNAIDISAFTLESGRKISVEEGWSGDADERGFLRVVRSEACGDFSTVLGPGSDSHHRDHFHLDLQERRSGSSYCN